MHIQIYTPEYSNFGGGISTFYKNLAPALVAEGCRVSVIEGSAYLHHISSDRRYDRMVEVQVLETARVNTWTQRSVHLSRLVDLRRSICAACAMTDQAKECLDTDVIEASDFGLLGLPAIIQGVRPVIIQAHASTGQIGLYDPSPADGLDAIISLALETWAGQQAADWQSYSQANADYWSRQSGRPVRYLRPAWESRPKDSPDSVTPLNQISIFGRIQRWKGPQVLCDALRLMPSTPSILWHGRDVHLRGMKSSTSQQLAADYPDVWGSRVRLNAPVPYADVLSIQERSLLNLIPSTWDVFNFTVIEAMDSGRPVVCSNGAGASELIEDGVTGFVYDGSSAEALAAALDRALSTPLARLQEIGRNAREHVARELDPKKIARERIASYEEAIRSHRIVSKRSVPGWVEQLVSPHESSLHPLSFLEQFPLRDITSYVGSRLLRKIGLGS